MTAVTQNITAEQGAALSVTFTGAGASLSGRTLRMHVREKVGSTATKLVASTSDSRLAVGADPYTTATLTVGADVMAALSITLPVEYWVYDVESYTSATDVRREWSGRFTITRDVTRDTEATADASLSGAVLYSGPQSLTAAQQLQARENIDFAEAARDVVGAALVAGSNVTITVSDAGDTITIASSGGGGGSISDGDKGDITVSASGATWTIDANAVTFAKMQAVSANVLLGNDATGTAVEEIACTAAGRALLDDADASAQRTTLGLGTAAVAATGDFEAAGAVATHAGATDPHGDRAFATSAVSTHNAVTTAHGISAFGATLVDDADASAARTTLGLGTAATSASGDFATAGHTHSGVYQPADAELTAIAGLASAADSAPYFTGSGTAALMTVTAAGRAILDDADATAQRATLGLVIGTNVQAYDADLTTWAGITPGTGVATAIGTNVGAVGAFVANGGALGTPSSGNLANCTFPTLNQNTSGYAEALKSATTTVSVSAATAPTSGQVLTATSGAAATWQTPSGGSPGGSSGQFQFNAAAAFGGANLWRESADIVALRNGATAETLYVYNTYTDTSNYERGYLKWDTNVFEVGAQVAGTGTARTMRFRPSNASRYMQLDTNCNLSFIGGGSIVSTINGTGGNCYFNVIYPSTSNNAIGYIYGDLTGSGTVFSFSGKDHANRGAFQLLAGTHAADSPANVTSTISGKNAFASASTNLAGGGVAIIGGAGASGSAGAATGGAVNLDGGEGYGTGQHGDIVIGNTRGMLRLKTYTVATLPVATTAGRRAFVSDASATTFHSVVAGGGANFVPVFSDGTNWRIG